MIRPTQPDSERALNAELREEAARLLERLNRPQMPQGGTLQFPTACPVCQSALSVRSRRGVLRSNTLFITQHS